MSLYRLAQLPSARLGTTRPFIPLFRTRYLLHSTIFDNQRSFISLQHLHGALVSSNEPSKSVSYVASIPASTPLSKVDSSISVYSPTSPFVECGGECSGQEIPMLTMTVSGDPFELQFRNVRIYKPSKSAIQSGKWNERLWKMDWDILPRGYRWENHLMGWQSSGDFLQGNCIFFKTKDNAINFAETQGYDWFIQERNKTKFHVKSYAVNFLHSRNKLRTIRTK
ncbi:ETC complex I subunit conserved region-domain-containing protein [Trichophaea hybrida]|nr:ETC complex I subunit conserved region-domain-containing protein [Trichophaea hybrida]